MLDAPHSLQPSVSSSHDELEGGVEASASAVGDHFQQVLLTWSKVNILGFSSPLLHLYVVWLD
jgi:hypothetical protein